MAAPSHRHNKLRADNQGKLRKGICENHQYSNPDTGEVGDCPECASGKIQAVNVQRLSDFKCDVCGGRLTPVKKAFPTKTILFALTGFILVAILALCSIWFCKDSPSPDPKPLPGIVPVDSIIVSKAKYTLYVGDSTRISARIVPSDATDTALIWRVRNPDIVSVSNGLVKAMSTGQAVIAISSGDGNASTEVTVNVVANIIEDEQTSVPPHATDDSGMLHSAAYVGSAANTAAAGIPDDIDDALNMLVDQSISRDDRLNSISGVINKFFVPSAKVRTLGNGDSVITVDYEDVEDFLRRIVMSRRIAEIQKVEEEKVRGKITEISIQEIHN